MKDQCLLGRLEGLEIAVAYVLTADTVGEAIRRHDCDPAAAHVLGRAMTASILAAASLGEGQRLNARWSYDGLLRTIVVDTGPDGATRALITPTHLAAAVDENALYGSLGDGGVSVIRSWNGAIIAHGSIITGWQNVVEDFNYFLCTSDQTESALAVTIALSPDPDVPVRLCRGILLQALPDCDLVLFERVRARLAKPPARNLLFRPEESDNLIENILHAVCEGESSGVRITLNSAPAPFFRCACARDKMGAVLRTLPYSERMDIVRKQEPVVVNCHFCRKRYELSVEECIQAWNQKGGPPEIK